MRVIVVFFYLRRKRRGIKPGLRNKKGIINMKKILLLAVLAILTCLVQAVFAQTAENKQLIPTVTIPAPEGSKGFGMPPAGNENNAPRIRWAGPSVTEPREIITTTLDELTMSDPFIFPYRKM